MNVNFDLGHAILTGMVGIVIFFLQRELARNDRLREEVLGLIKNCNERLTEHEGRITRHGTNQALMQNDLKYLQDAMRAQEARVKELEAKMHNLHPKEIT